MEELSEVTEEQVSTAASDQLSMPKVAQSKSIAYGHPRKFNNKLSV